MSELQIIRDSGVAVLTFCRPERRNALSLGLMRDLDNQLADLAEDADIRVVILTGAGDKAFGAGLDIKEAATLDEAAHQEQHAHYESIQRRMAAFPKPLIAAIEGVAAGASLQIALHCDLIIVAEGGRIGMPELSAGRPCIMGSYLLASRIGPIGAARLVLGQDWFDAETALSSGLASLVTPTGGAMDAALAYAGKIAATAPNALAATLSWLRQLRNGASLGLVDAFAKADEILPDAAGSDEAVAASTRFAEKRNA